MKAAQVKNILEDADLVFQETKSHFILKECPNCGGEDKLYISKKKFLWQCFKCAGEGNETRSGNLYKLLLNVIGLDKTTALQMLKDGEPVEQVPFELPPIQYDNNQTVIVTKKCYNHGSPVSPPTKLVQYSLPSNFFALDCSQESFQRFPSAYKYLFTRNVNSREQILSFKLKYDPARRRLIFPAFIEQGYCIGYQGRDITTRWKSLHPKCTNYKCEDFHTTYFTDEYDDPKKCPSCGSKTEPAFYPKSVNSNNFPKTEFFFNQQNVDWNKPVVIVEGPFDCINTPNSIGLLGKFLSDTQFMILKDNVKELVLYLDGDTSGTASTQDIYNKMSVFIPSIRIVPLRDGEDPGSLTQEVNCMKIQDAVSFSEWASLKNILCL